MRYRDLTLVILPAIVLGLVGCSRVVPDDFHMIIDARRAVPDADTAAEHIFLEIFNDGGGRYTIYDTGGAIVHDENGMLVISADQVRVTGDFKLGRDQMERVWQALQENSFFDLSDDYRMSIGSAYAFVVVTAGGNTNGVDNIGIEVPEIEKLIDILNSVLPGDLRLAYTLPGLW